MAMRLSSAPPEELQLRVFEALVETGRCGVQCHLRSRLCSFTVGFAQGGVGQQPLTQPRYGGWHPTLSSAIHLGAPDDDRAGFEGPQMVPLIARPHDQRQENCALRAAGRRGAALNS